MTHVVVSGVPLRIRLSDHGRAQFEDAIEEAISLVPAALAQVLHKKPSEIQSHEAARDPHKGNTEVFHHAVDRVTEVGEDGRPLMKAFSLSIIGILAPPHGSHDSSGVDPMMLQNSTTADCFRYLLSKLKKIRSLPLEVGWILCCVLEALHPLQAHSRSEGALVVEAKALITGQLFDLFAWLVEEILEKELGTDELWKQHPAEVDVISPLALACVLGELEVVRFMAARGADVHCLTTKADLAPAVNAFAIGHREMFQVLLENGLSLSKTFERRNQGRALPETRRYSLLSDLIQREVFMTGKIRDSVECRARRLEILLRCFDAQPEALHSAHVIDLGNDEPPFEAGLLDLCIVTDDVDLVRALVEKGLELVEESRPSLLDPAATKYAALLLALHHRSCKTIKWLVEEKGALRDWRSRYSESFQQAATDSFGIYCMDSISKKEAAKSRRECSSIRDMLLAAGFTRNAGTDGHGNEICSRILCETDDLIGEEAALDLLSKLHGAGVRIDAPLSPSAAGESLLPLHGFASCGFSSVVEFFIDVVGTPVDCVGTIVVNEQLEQVTPLSRCIRKDQLQTALLLVTKYKAKGVLPDFFVTEQPLMFVAIVKRELANEARLVMQAMLKNQPDVLHERTLLPVP
jgi:hypothetical protein